ncbi:transglutaminase [Sphingomonas oleivorans]|uniref:Transglutaminase n=1 Tax=Sphingomonas oleivorans TaxID=1735121 RepID=A0A2T5G0V8_9SPHN|nr:transglutaminase family protein [Sphingomonas oleivorans]PTQ12773.1 transglutaminase [Sphingomonas oleivorans]
MTRPPSCPEAPSGFYKIRHRTHFRYVHPVRFARCNLRLRPVDWPGQVLEDYALEVTPAAEIIVPRSGAGYLANMTRIGIDQPASEIVIESRMRMRVDRPMPMALPEDPTVAEICALARASADLSALSPANYIFASPHIALFREIAEWCATELAPSRGIFEAGLALTQAIRAEFRYDGNATETDTSPAEAFANRHGVCQDFAQIMISGLRAAGLPAAYVSGYLRTLPPPGMPRLVGADATHAWVLIWCGPARGWIGFDPTNGCAMGRDHIITAVGRDYADVAPIDGIFLGRDGQKIDVSVDVEPVEEAEAILSD